jgi:receptor protein-tyrosine kinase
MGFDAGAGVERGGMGIVELATRRLEELRRSGIELPHSPKAQTAATPQESLLSRASRRLADTQQLEPTPAEPHKLLQTAEDAPPVHAEATTIAGDGMVPDGSTALRSKAIEIDLERLQAMGYLTAQTPRTQIASDFRVVKRQLLVNVTDAATKNANLIMVTSALPNEGKTFVAINLAISMAMEVDRTVLLVDADVARPSILARLGVAPAAGLLDLLADPSVRVSDVMLRTNIDKLTLVPSGAPREHATEMLASDTMNRLLNELSTHYPDRVIVFDAPPLLPSTESRVLATHMGQVILVVEAKRTPKKAVEQALATVESCPMVLPLLNKAARSEVGAYYGYYGLERS